MTFFIRPTPLLAKKKILTKHFDTSSSFVIFYEALQGFLLILLCTVLTNAGVHTGVGHPDLFLVFCCTDLRESTDSKIHHVSGQFDTFEGFIGFGFFLSRKIHLQNCRTLGF